jgi:hypothetical protein
MAHTSHIPPQHKRMYDLVDLVILFGVSNRTIETWLRRGIIPPPVRVGATANAKSVRKK